MMYDPDGRMSMDLGTGFWNNSQDGTTWYNTGAGFTSTDGISMDYDGNSINWSQPYTNMLLANIGITMGTTTDGEGGVHINIPPIVLSKSSFFWGIEIRSHVNEYMDYWNSNSQSTSIYSFRNRIGDQVLPAKESILGKIWSFMSPREWEDSDGLSYQVNSSGRITNVTPLMGDVPFGLGNTVKGYNITSTAVRSALGDRIGKRGFLEVGYQFQKHFGRGGNWTIPQGVKQNPAMFNQAGYDTFKEIWRSPGSFQKVGGFIEKRLSDGRGIRFQENWKFKGFLD